MQENKSCKDGENKTDDYHAFNSTSGDSGGEAGGDGCLSWNAIAIIAVICAILTLIGRCSG